MAHIFIKYSSHQCFIQNCKWSKDIYIYRRLTLASPAISVVSDMQILGFTTLLLNWNFVYLSFFPINSPLQNFTIFKFVPVSAAGLLRSSANLPSVATDIFFFLWESRVLKWLFIFVYFFFLIYEGWCDETWGLGSWKQQGMFTGVGVKGHTIGWSGRVIQI